MGAATLILPIETKVRELYGKALLALYAAEAGMEVVLGDQRVISQSLHRLPVGIYLDKSISRTKSRHFARLRNLGFRLAAQRTFLGLVRRARHTRPTWEAPGRRAS